MDITDTSYHSPGLTTESEDPTCVFESQPGPATPSIKHALSPLASIQLRAPGPSIELTPPPSPDRQPSPVSWKETGQGLLQRAATIASRRTSPERSPIGTKRSKPKGSISGIADLFSGTSAPVSLGIVPSPRKEAFGDDGPFNNSLSGRPSQQHRRGSSLQVAASLLGLSSKTSLSRSRFQRRITEEDFEDEILNLDLEAELFPMGVPGQDALPSEAYDDLLANASRLFQRMQNAYRDQHTAFREVKASANFDQEELEEAKIRAKHLKLQLDGMSNVVAEQDADMKNIKAELDEERGRRRLEHQLRQNTVKLVRQSRIIDMSTLNMGTLETPDLSAVDLSDLQLERMNLESDNESEADSVFSKDSRGASSASSTTRTEQAASEAMAPWVAPQATAGVSSSSEEIRQLKQRIAELEETVQGCLGLVG